MRKIKIDWIYYTQLPWWTLDEACALSLNKDPESFDRDHPSQGGSSAAAATRLEFVKRRNLLYETIMSDTLKNRRFEARGGYPGRHVQPADFAKWIHGLGRSPALPVEIMQLIPATVVADAESVQPANPSHGSRPARSQAEAANPSWPDALATKAKSKKPFGVHQQMVERFLQAITEMGLDPQALPRADEKRVGLSGVRSRVAAALVISPSDTGFKSFTHHWERALESGAIAWAAKPK